MTAFGRPIPRPTRLFRYAFNAGTACRGHHRTGYSSPPGCSPYVFSLLRHPSSSATPSGREDADLAVSPLIRMLPETSAAGPGDPATARRRGGTPRRRRKISPDASALEILHDHYGPASDDVALRGGDLPVQAPGGLPVQGFCRTEARRQGAEEPEPGLNALDRGRLLHRVLERIWGRLKSHGHLLAATEEGLADLGRGHVEPEVRRILDGRARAQSRSCGDRAGQAGAHHR